MSDESTARLQPLDAIRGIAAMMVVLFHYTAHNSMIFPPTYQPGIIVSWGYLGVNFFFMVSGFVIFMTLCKTINSWDFVVSRFSRLYPTYWFAVLATTATVTLYGVQEALRTPQEVLINLTMLQGFMQVRNVDGVYWTLTYELLFYAWMFLLFRLNRLAQIERFLGAWLLMAAASHILTLVYGHFPWKITFSLLLQYAHLFAAGILFYLIYAGKANRVTYGLLGLCVVNQLLVARPGSKTLSCSDSSPYSRSSRSARRDFSTSGRSPFSAPSLTRSIYCTRTSGIVLLDILRRAGVRADLRVALVIIAAVSARRTRLAFHRTPSHARHTPAIRGTRMTKSPVPSP